MTNKRSHANTETKAENQEPRHESDPTEVEVDVRDIQETEASPKSDSPESPAPEAAAEPSLEQQLADARDRYLRLAAEFDNYRKRTSRQFTELREVALGEIVDELLTIQDNFERALVIDDNKTDLASFKKGVEMIFEQLKGLLARNGLEPFESVGHRFDPNLHDAMMTVETDEHEEGVVVEEMSRGYRLKDRVIRHAKVAVAKARERSNETE